MSSPSMATTGPEHRWDYAELLELDLLEHAVFPEGVTMHRYAVL